MLNFVQPHNQPKAARGFPKALIIDGPRAAGKTDAISALGKLMPIAPIKFREFIDVGVSHAKASLIRMDYGIRMLEQMQAPITPLPVFDRMIGTDLVMSIATGREADYNLLGKIECAWADIAIQVVLTASPSIRVARMAMMDRKPEGDMALIDRMWKEFIEGTPIKTLVLDTTEIPPSVIAQYIRRFILKNMSHKSGG